jgi:hypothetical protein
MPPNERRTLFPREYGPQDPQLIRLQVLIPLSLLVSIGAVLVAVFVPDPGMGLSLSSCYS